MYIKKYLKYKKNIGGAAIANIIKQNNSSIQINIFENEDDDENDYDNYI